MKKFIKIVVCFCLCVVSIAFTACGKKSKIEAPEANATVSSNGGIVVQKGDFTYYANGYKSVDNVKKSNLDDKYALGGLYVTKANNSNVLERDENGSLTYNNRLSSKLSSFEATDLHIFGDYMYYTTINTEQTKKGGLQTKELQIYRVKLNGTGSKRVYSSNIDFEDSEGKRVVNFEYFEENGNVYILVHENGTLKRVSCGKSISTSTIATNVLSYKTASDDNNKNAQIFFTTTDDGNYQINRYNIVSNNIETKLTLDSGDTISSIFAVKFNNLYFYATFEDVGEEFLYRMPISNIDNEDSVYVSSIKLTAISYTSVYLLNSYSDGILVFSSSKVEIIDATNPTEGYTPKYNMPTDATVMMVEDSYVYFYKDKEIKRWNYTTDEVELIFTETNTICNYAFDIVGDYLYYYAKVNSNDYLFRVSISGTTEDKKSELMGVYETADIPEKEEAEEGTEEE